MPAAWMAARTLRTVQRVLQYHPVVAHMWMDLLASAGQRGHRPLPDALPGSPVDSFRTQLTRIGIRLVGETLECNGLTLHYRHLPWTAIRRHLFAQAQQSMAANVVERAGMNCEEGLDVSTTIKAYTAVEKALPFGGACLHRAVCGAFHPEARFAEWARKPKSDGELRFTEATLTHGRVDGLCKLWRDPADRVECGAPETRQHAWWECPGTDHIRQQYAQELPVPNHRNPNRPNAGTMS